MNTYRVRQGYEEAVGTTTAQITRNGAQGHWRRWKLEHVSKFLFQTSSERDSYTTTIQQS